jgi:hypothetical protein
MKKLKVDEPVVRLVPNLYLVTCRLVTPDTEKEEEVDEGNNPEEEMEFLHHQWLVPSLKEATALALKVFVREASPYIELEGWPENAADVLVDEIAGVWGGGGDSRAKMCNEGPVRVTVRDPQGKELLRYPRLEEEEAEEEEEEEEKEKKHSKEALLAVRCFVWIAKSLPLPKDVVKLIGQGILRGWQETLCVGMVPELGEFETCYLVTITSIIPTYDLYYETMYHTFFDGAEAEVLERAKEMFISEINRRWRGGFAHCALIESNFQYYRSEADHAARDRAYLFEQCPRQFNLSTLPEFSRRILRDLWVCDDNLGHQSKSGPASLTVEKFEKTKEGLSNPTILFSLPENDLTK